VFVDAGFSETGISLNGDWDRNVFDFIGFTVTVTDSAPLLHEMTIDWNGTPVPPWDDGSGVSRATALVFPPDNPALAIAGVCSAGSGYTSCGADNGKSVNSTLFFDPETGAPVDLRQAHVQVEALQHGGSGFTSVNITFSQVPEPSTLLLLATAAGVLSWRIRTRAPAC
ncbi:MAG TPA: PEP-CTERM sorting domain-containing protein, partial [Bryobacteraceae bacterium]|nr:PEP-CTERM sorting domain-containing protein [Bryobacteraceae bacterium]